MTKFITICGSMKSIDEMRLIRQELIKTGLHIFIPDDSELSTTYNHLPDTEKRFMKLQFIDKHLQKIKKSDFILVVNAQKNSIPGYIGANMLMEMAFAYALGKPIIVLYPIGDQNCEEEANAILSINLMGNLGNLKKVIDNLKIG